MLNDYTVTIVEVDQYGNFRRETLPLKEALLTLLRFSRHDPTSVCTIELRQIERPLGEGTITRS